MQLHFPQQMSAIMFLAREREVYKPQPWCNLFLAIVFSAGDPCLVALPESST